MSGLAIRRGKVIGVTATAAVLLATLAGGGAAQAAQHPDASTERAAPRAAASRGGVHAAAATHIPSVCSIRTFAPRTIVLGTAKVTKTFSVAVDDCTLDIWSVVLWPFVSSTPLSTAGIAGNYWYWDTDAAGDKVKVQLKSKISLSPRYLSNSYAGSLQQGSTVWAWGEEDPPDSDDLIVDPAERFMTIILQRRATFGSTFNASPEPVKKGKKISLKASLARVNWNGAKTLKYVGFAGTARVQFKAAGTTTYVTKKTVKSNSKGKVSTTITATKSGTWRLYFPGLSTTAPAISTTDVVKVN